MNGFHILQGPHLRHLKMGPLILFVSDQLNTLTHVQQEGMSKSSRCLIRVTKISPSRRGINFAPRIWIRANIFHWRRRWRYKERDGNRRLHHCVTEVALESPFTSLYRRWILFWPATPNPFIWWSETEWSLNADLWRPCLNLLKCNGGGMRFVPD